MEPNEILSKWLASLALALVATVAAHPVEHQFVPEPTPVPSGSWHHDKEISWYGPGFYGRRTACGLALTTRLVGVAHRTLPCGTLIEFRWRGKRVTMPVVDRGPYVRGRVFDLTGGACLALKHCFTGPIDWRMKE